MCEFIGPETKTALQLTKLSPAYKYPVSFNFEVVNPVFVVANDRILVDGIKRLSSLTSKGSLFLSNFNVVTLNYKCDNPADIARLRIIYNKNRYDMCFDVAEMKMLRGEKIDIAVMCDICDMAMAHKIQPYADLCFKLKKSNISSVLTDVYADRTKENEEGEIGDEISPFDSLQMRIANVSIEDPFTILQERLTEDEFNEVKEWYARQKDKARAESVLKYMAFLFQDRGRRIKVPRPTFSEIEKLAKIWDIPTILVVPFVFQEFLSKQ
ncbi:MAG: hypothetical protein JZD41_02370 [Thermoproteus sp.]|nr:hypothetical protein [Thermoproteus sp.]